MKRSLVLLQVTVLLLAMVSLLPLSQGQEVIVVFDEGHRQYYDSRKLSMFLDDLRERYRVVINKDAITTEDLSGASILIIPNPRQAFSDEEVMAVREFVEGGGVLIVMGDWYRYINVEELNRLVEGTGIKFTKTEVMDSTAYDYKPYFPLVNVWADNEAATYISSKVGLKKIKYNGCMLKVTDPAQPILYSRKQAYVVNEKNQEIAKGSAPVAAYAKLGNGLVIAIGGSRVAATRYFYEKNNLGNREFMLALVEWALTTQGLLRVKLELNAEPSRTLFPLGVERDLTLLVKVKNLGVSVESVRVTVESEFYTETKQVEKLESGEETSLEFAFTVFSETPGTKVVKVSVEAEGYRETLEVPLHFASERSVALLDMGHGEYYGPDDMKGFVELLGTAAPVVVSKGALTPEVLSLAKIVVLANPEEPLSRDEIRALHEWVETGGKLIIAGHFYRYFEPSIHNSITVDYGIVWLDGSVRDPEHCLPKRPYAFFAGKFADNEIAAKLAEGVSKVFFSGTSLVLKGEAVPVVVGWDTTLTVDEKNATLARGEEVVLVAMAKAGKGYVFALGGVWMMLDERYNVSIFETNKKLFENVLAFTHAPPKKIVEIPILSFRADAPTELREGEEGELRVTVTNEGNGTATNVVISLTVTGIEIDKTREALGDVAPGASATAVFKISAVKAGKGYIKVSIQAENHETVSGSIELNVSPKPPTVDVALVVAVVIAAALVVAILLIGRKRRHESTKAR